MTLHRYLLAAALALVPWAALAQPASATIQGLAAQALLPEVDHPWDGRDWLDRFYAPRGYAPAWSAQQAEAALALLAHAADEGLDPQDYQVARLRAMQGRQRADPGNFDVALTAEMLHYLADLRLGRVPPEYESADGAQYARQFDPVAVLAAALAGGDVAGLAAHAEPTMPTYGRVRELLARYRLLAATPQPQLPAPPVQLAAGANYPAARDLHQRLVSLGDLDAATPEPAGAVFDAALSGAVRRFQLRHGLAGNGMLDAATVEALNVPLAERVRQLELTLERLRWLPHFPGDSLVAVDLPAYRLWAFDRTAPHAAPLEMKVIVGDAMKTPTPLFIGQMRYLDFHPYWNVPHSIVVKEIIPALERSPGYLARHNMELLGRGGPVRVDASTISLLREGRLRVRQRPGPKNSLGAVKFAMPNPMDIYLHGTPQRELFRRTRRDLSHGCIRVEKPAELAQFVLRDQPQWTGQAIAQALAPGPTHRVDLSAPIPVVIFYATAIADRDGKAVFVPDVYGLDPKLEEALREHSAGSHAENVSALASPTE